MKLPLFLFFLLLAHVSLADCFSHGIWTYPKSGSKIHTNSRFIFDFYAGSEKVVDSIKAGTIVLLKSTDGTDSLELLPVEYHTGDYNLEQVVLKPSKLLLSGKTYALYIEGLDVYNQNLINGENDRAFYRKERFHWTVNKEADLLKPQWVEEPTFTHAQNMPYGCGPELHTYFKFKAKDSSALYMRVSFQKPDESCTEFIVSTENSSYFYVGVDMCRGPFQFKKDRQYSVRFSLLDACGNETDFWTSYQHAPNPLGGPAGY